MNDDKPPGYNKIYFILYEDVEVCVLIEYLKYLYWPWGLLLNDVQILIEKN